VPHGFGHDRPGVGWRLAAEKAGASVNDITDPSVVDALTGNAAFNAVPVRLEAAARITSQVIDSVVGRELASSP
jgi:hypothetical protein